jgi:HD-like signal output (HDOD) protein/nitrogen-specific signal transduction histidine kinase
MHSLPEPILQAIETGRVPSPPQVLLRLLQMVDDDRTTMAELASLVKQDAGLCARVLATANSPALRRGNQLGNLENCLVTLGTRLVRSIATCLSVQSMFDRHSGSVPVDLAAFWSHSLLVAELAHDLAVAADYANPDEAYLAGLLHDIGELILLSAIGEPYAHLLASCEDESILPALETAQFGAHHGEIGTWLVDQWQLDSLFADGILFHHHPANQITTAATLPKLVWLAHALATCDAVTPELIGLADQVICAGSGNKLGALRDQSEQKMCVIAEGLGFSPPDRMVGGRTWGLPLVKLPHQWKSHGGAEDDIAAIIGGMALMQPLQQNLFTLDCDAEVLLSLRESARILFDLNRLAFLLSDPVSGQLSGSSIGGQPAVFRHAEIPAKAPCSLAAAASVEQDIRSSFDGREPSPAALIDMQFARAFASEGLLCVPMLGRNRTIGVMVCGLSAGQHARLSRRLPWLLNFGRIAAVSLESLQEAQAYRQQAERDASKRFSQQARRVVHEAGNPLGIIKSYLKILDGKLPDEVDVRQELAVLTEEIDRVANIVQHMSEIPETQPLSGSVDVGALVRELLVLYGDPLFRVRSIQLDAIIPDVATPVAIDRNSLKQILLNFWKNASEALTMGQRFSIEVRDNVVHNGAQCVELRMEDNGPGLPLAAQRVLHRIEKPRVEDLQSKRGLGLSIVGALIEKLGIPLTCRSQDGEGASITLLLPKKHMEQDKSSNATAVPG